MHSQWVGGLRMMALSTFVAALALVSKRWSPIFGQVVKVESRSDRRNLECHERDGATRLS